LGSRFRACEIYKCKKDGRARLANASLNTTSALVSEGSLAPIDIVAAEAQVASSSKLCSARWKRYRAPKNSLKNLIAVNRQADLWNLSVVPTDSVDLVPPDISLPEAFESGYGQPAGVTAVKYCPRDQSNRSEVFREQTRPGIDLVGSYGMVGFGRHSQRRDKSIHRFV